MDTDVIVEKKKKKKRKENPSISSIIKLNEIY